MEDGYYNFSKNKVERSTKLEFLTPQKSIFSQERYLNAIKTFKYRQVLAFKQSGILEL